jgi:hypothetical protein
MRDNIPIFGGCPVDEEFLSLMRLETVISLFASECGGEVGHRADLQSVLNEVAHWCQEKDLTLITVHLRSGQVKVSIERSVDTNVRYAWILACVLAGRKLRVKAA